MQNRTATVNTTLRILTGWNSIFAFVASRASRQTVLNRILGNCVLLFPCRSDPLTQAAMCWHRFPDPASCICQKGVMIIVEQSRPTSMTPFKLFTGIALHDPAE